MTSRRLVIGGALLVVAVAVGIAAMPRAETGTQRVERLASELRCPVCQGLSVNDSPSESAQTMRDLIARRVAEGRSDDEIRDEFRRAYGDWIFLSPPVADARGLVWLVPLAVIVVGLVVAWSRVAARAIPSGPPSPAQLAALRERARTEEPIE